MTNRLAMLAILAHSLAPAFAQSKENLDLSKVNRDARWKIVGRTASVVQIKGKRAIQLGEGAGMGVVWLDRYDFENGTIEIDLLGRSEPIQGSFLGVVFRAVDGQTNDAVYFRPFNFRASDPARQSHAVQYVSHPRWPWQTLRSEFPGKYEKALRPAPDGDEWFHVRIVVERPKVAVFVNGASDPALTVNELSDRGHGSVGLWVGEGSGGNFANLTVRRSP